MNTEGKIISLPKSGMPLRAFIWNSALCGLAVAAAVYQGPLANMLLRPLHDAEAVANVMAFTDLLPIWILFAAAFLHCLDCLRSLWIVNPGRAHFHYFYGCFGLFCIARAMAPGKFYTPFGLDIVSRAYAEIAITTLLFGLIFLAYYMFLTGKVRIVFESEK